ncbi:MAG: T9SS type A sorting domain-containing protein [Bacteroidota bacterium]|nr:T9SS type A sorting domain-containing protein [Bacteroidota bacterium]
MKTIKNSKSLIKLLFVGIFALFINSAIAQPNLCPDPCTTGPLIWETIPLCKFSNTISWYNPGPPPGGGTETFTDVPFVFVMIAYRIRDCGGIKSIIIDDYVFVDSRDYWNNTWLTLWGGAGAVTSPIPGVDIIPAAYISGCTYPDPPTAASMNLAVTDAINKLLTKFGNPAQSDYDIYFKGACFSLVTLSFPNGAFFVGTPDDLGHVDTMYVSAGSTVTQSIPCSDKCCKVSYRWKVITLENGETTSRWVVVSTEGDEAGCEQQPMPDYNTYTPKLEAKIFDPITGTYNTVNGTFVSQEPCELTCPRFLAPPPPESPGTSVKTDINGKDVHLELSAIPIPFNNFIRITSNNTITKVVVYDMSGKKVLITSKLENGELNTSELKTGVYFVQVHFPNNMVKSIKVIKQ